VVLGLPSACFQDACLKSKALLKLGLLQVCPLQQQVVAQILTDSLVWKPLSSWKLRAEWHLRAMTGLRKRHVLSVPLVQLMAVLSEGQGLV
jgi:hypothetical protein